MISSTIHIEKLIEIVRKGGSVKTGMDVYNANGVLLLDKDVLVTKIRILDILKENGLTAVPLNSAMNGGIWDENGNAMIEGSDGIVDLKEPDIIFPDRSSKEIENRLIEIQQIKKEAEKKYNIAKNCIKKVLTDIRETGGQFDYEEVETHVTDLVDFLISADNPFSFMTQELFSYDDYLYNHSTNVCAIGTAILHRFNSHFSGVVDNFLTGNSPLGPQDSFESDFEKGNQYYTCYYADELSDISLGFFLHDVGKVMVNEAVLNQTGRLSPKDFEEVKKHSFEYGMMILDKNNLKNAFIKNIIKYHHAPLFINEERCYPLDRSYTQVPVYARICKLADIYDAMTSRRVYKEAINQINVVTRMFRTYAQKDAMLQYVLHAFVKSIGIYPPGSIIYLKNRQMAYVLESDGPVVIPFTDGAGNTLQTKPDPIDISALNNEEPKQVDNSRSISNPKDVFDLLPAYLKRITTAA